MTKHPPLPGAPRRQFLKTGAGWAALGTIDPLPVASLLAADDPPSIAKSIGIQIGAVSFVDEGTDAVLNLLQKRGAVDTIYLTTFTYGRGLAGRQIPGHPFPDHGSQQSDQRTFHGGNYATPHAEFYRDTVLKQTRAPDHEGVDIVAAVLPAAKKRGMRVVFDRRRVPRGRARRRGSCRSRSARPQDQYALPLPS